MHQQARIRWALLAAAAVCAAALSAPPPKQESQAASARAAEGPTGAEWVQMAKDVQAEVEKLRGWKFKTPVKTDVYDEAQLRRYLESKLFDQIYGGGKLRNTEAFLRMIGLIPGDCDLKQTFLDVLLNQVGGFYDPETKTFYMLKRSGVDYGPLLNRTLVAHELTHALDDQYVDLQKLAFDPELSEDAALAVGSILEGSATALMTRYMMQAMGSGQYDAAQLAEVQMREMQRAEPLLRAPPYFSALIAQYMCGMLFVYRGDPTKMAGDSNEADDVLAALKDPPRSSEQILHPEKYWRAGRRDEPVLVDDRQIQALIQSERRHVIHANTVGELLCALLSSDEHRELNLIAAAQPTFWTNDAATGWGGDRFYLLADGPDREAASKGMKGLRGVWITAWDTADDRDEFIEDYLFERALPQREVVRLAPRVAVFFYGFDYAERVAIEKKLVEAPLKLTCGGKPWNPARP